MSVLVHVGVRASDLEESVRFWRDGLGLKVVRPEDTCCDLSDGYHNFKIFQHAGESRPEHVGGMLDYLHVGVGVSDVPAAARRLREMDYEIFSDGLWLGNGRLILTILRTGHSRSRIPMA